MNGIPQLDREYKPNRSGIQARLLDPKFTIWIYNTKKEALREKLIARIEKESLERYNRLMKAEEDLNGGRKEEVDYNTWSQERELALKERKQKTKGLNRNEIAEYLEIEKIEIELPEIPRFCSLIEVNKYADCPMHHEFYSRRTLIDCYNCSFFYKIKTVPKTKCEFVICSFQGEEGFYS